MRALILAGALLVAPSLAEAGNPWEELMGPGKARLWTDPEGRFFLDLPVGWTAEARRGETGIVDFTKLHPDNGYAAHVTVEIRTVPPDVKTAHFADRVEDETRRQAPGYRLLERDRAQISGISAVRTYFTFRELQNAELTNEGVQLVLVNGERAFIITFVAAAGTRGVFWEDFEKMVKGFGARAPGDESPMPKQRKKVRAGEMVNPDAVGY